MSGHFAQAHAEIKSMPHSAADFCPRLSLIFLLASAQNFFAADFRDGNDNELCRRKRPSRAWRGRREPAKCAAALGTERDPRYNDA